MKKIYTMLGQQNTNLSLYGNEDGTLFKNFDSKVKFPLSAFLSTIVKKDEPFIVVAVDSFDSPASKENNLLLEQELKNIYGNSCEYRYMKANFTYCQKGQVETFKELYNSFESGDEVYFDITFGLKPTPMTVFVACNYVQKFMKDVKIKRLVYAHYDFNDPDRVHPIVDVTSLFLLNSLIDTLSMMDSQKPMDFISQVFEL